MVSEHGIKWTAIPTIYIDQVDPNLAIDRDNKRNATIRIVNSHGSNYPLDQLFTGSGTIKGRGNSSWTEYPKKPFNFTLTDSAFKKVSLGLFGMPANSDWALLAIYQDKTFMRSMVGSALGWACKMPWSPRMQHVHFILNGVDKGLFALSEKAEEGPARINLKSTKGLDTEWVIEQQLQTQIKTGEKNFRSGSPEAKWYTFKVPESDKPTDAQVANTKAIYDDLQARLYGTNFKDPTLGYRAVIDVKSWIRFGIYQDIGKNSDIYVNSWMTTYKAGKIGMGPGWDFDGYFGLFPPGYWISSRFQGSGNLSNPNDTFIAAACATYERMMTDPWFMEQWAIEFKELLPRMHQVLQDYRDYYPQLIASGVPDIDRGIWAGIAPDVLNNSLYKPLPNYTAEVQWMDWFITQRLYYQNRKMFDLLPAAKPAKAP